MAEGTSAYREVILKTLREREWREGKGFGVWVVQTIKDDKSFRVQVRAGMYRPDKVTGEKILPKDGLDEGDFKTTHADWKEVEALLQIPKGTAVPPPGSELDAAAGPEPELPPWMK